jgi:DHA1 family tetracycline resistance protein-like MFS transporter
VLAGLAGVMFLSNVAHTALPATFVLYAGYRFGWDARDVGFALAAVGASSALVQGVMVGPMVRRFGDRPVLLAGLLFGAAGFCAYGLAPTGVLFLAAVPVVAMWGLASPTAQGLMSQQVGASQYGELQGAAGAVMGVATMFGPTLFAATFAWFIGADAPVHLPGAAYLLSALLLAAAAALAARVTSPGVAR